MTTKRDIRSGMLATTLSKTIDEMVDILHGELDGAICARCLDCMGSCSCDGDYGSPECHEYGKACQVETAIDAVRYILGTLA